MGDYGVCLITITLFDFYFVAISSVSKHGTSVVSILEIVRNEGKDSMSYCNMNIPILPGETKLGCNLLFLICTQIFQLLGYHEFPCKG